MTDAERERIETAADAAADAAEPLTEVEQRKLRILLARDRAA
jgi:uncharacterized membrane protein